MKTFLILSISILLLHSAQGQPGLTIFDINQNPTKIKYDGGNWSRPTMLTVFKNRLYFIANDSLHGFELWRVDSTGQPARISDLAPGPQYGLLHPSAGNLRDGKMGIYKDGANKEWLVFQGWNTAHGGMVLYKCDGVSAPSVAATVAPGDNLNTLGFVNINNELYFCNSRGGPQYGGTYRYNPLTGAIKRIVTFSAGATYVMAAYQGKLYYGTRPTPGQADLYAYDPAADTSILVKSHSAAAPNISEMIVVGNDLYFNMAGTLYKYDPAVTPEPTIVGYICDEGGKINTTYYNLLAEYKGKLVYPCVNTNSVCATCLYDPANGQTTRTTAGPYPAAFASHKGKLYFHAGYYKDVHPADTFGGELWEYRGGTDTPRMVVDIWPGYHSHPAYSSFPERITSLGEYIFFNALKWETFYQYGRELMKYDPRVLSVSNPAFGGSVTVYPNPTGGDAVLAVEVKENTRAYVAVHDITGRELYRGDVSTYRQGKTLVHLPIGYMAAGNYYYSLRSAEGVLLVSGKIVKM